MAAAATALQLAEALRGRVPRCLRQRPAALLGAQPWLLGGAAAPAAALQHPCQGAAASQRRWWYDVDARRSKYDKPSVTGARYTFVRGQVPVVLLDDIRGIGRKGQIVSIKRGYARHHLVPKGLAVFGTWENIDAHADPELVEDPALKARVAAEKGRLPFDWVDDVRLHFVRWAREDKNSELLEPITAWDVLEALSADHELDLLPTNVDMPEGGISRVGVHEVPVRVAFRKPDAAAGRYTVLVEAVSEQSQIEERRAEEMAKAVASSMRFQLPQRAGGMAAGDLEEEEDEDEEGKEAKDGAK